MSGEELSFNLTLISKEQRIHEMSKDKLRNRNTTLVLVTL